MSLVMDSPPAGTFNYSADREYTAAEAIDLLNDVLKTKGYTLVRRNQILVLTNHEPDREIWSGCTGSGTPIHKVLMRC